ncbi:MAG: M15 family metallopeptidase [Bacteroidota bacterium]|nr:M15 family metallopeptidase [Bacteroidota bacterium]
MLKINQLPMIILQVSTIIFIYGCSPIANYHAKKENSLPLTTSKRAYLQALQQDPNEKMIDIKQYIPSISLDLKYATKNNFTHKRMYSANTSTTFLRKPAANALLAVQKELNNKGLGLKIFDAYRPFSVTLKFWDLIHDERYVANPSKGSGHNRGTAVDLTLIELNSKHELDMGTGFDNFSDSAHHSFTKFSENILHNRLLLQETMEKYGFKKLDTEWWHYSWPRQFSVLNLSFTDLQKLQ